MLKQLEKYLFKQLAFSAFVVAASALLEEVRVGIVVLYIVVGLLKCSPKMLVGGL